MANKTSNVNTLQLDGYTMTPDSTEVTVLLRDPDGYILLASDADVPSGEAGYAVGCIFIDTDATGVSNIFLVNEGTISSCSFVTATASTTFNALTDTNLNPATATAGTVPCVAGGVLTAKAGLVFGTTTATSGNVLTANGTTWGTATPDTAGLVAKTGNQTVAGDKTFSGTTTLGAVTAGDNITLGTTKYLYFGDTDSYIRSASAGELTITAKTTASGTLSLDGYDMLVGASATGGITVGSLSGAGALALQFGTGGFTCIGPAAATISLGAAAQTGDITIGQSTAANEVKIATGNGNKTLTMVTGTGTNTVNLCSSTGTDTVNIATGAGAKVVTIGSVTGASSLSLKMGTGNFSLAGAAASTITIGKSDQSGKISIGDSTGTLTIDVGVGGTAVKTVNIANENGQVHVIGIGGTNSLPTLTGTTVTVEAGTLFDVNGAMDVSGDLTAVDVDASGMVTADSFHQAKMYWCDDFMETAAVLASTVISKVYWTGGGTNGTQTIAADQNGVIQLSTTATGSSTSTLTYGGASTFDNDLAWIFEARVKTSDITNTKIDLGMYVDTNDEIIFRFDTDVDAANIYLVTENNNGDEVVTDTTVDLTADTYFTFKIEVSADDSFEVFINDTEVLESHPANTIRDVAFKPYFYVDNKAAAEEKILSIDYVKVWQDREA